MIMKSKTIKSNGTIKGRYQIITFKASTKEIIRKSDWIDNLIVEGTGTGTQALAQALAGEIASIEITRSAIGTGTTTPTDSDTDLATPTVTDIEPILASSASNVATIEFFITDGQLANGTYNEFGIYIGDSWANRKLFARSIISPAYSKGSNEDTQINYQLTVNN